MHAELDRFGFFDHGKGAVNCHLKPSPASVGALQGLAEAIDGCLPAELAAKQKRPFSPHLTVGQMPRAEYTERREAWERRRPTDSVFADHDHDRAWTGFATWARHLRHHFDRFSLVFSSVPSHTPRE